MLIDTHCHVHESDYELDDKDIIKNAHDAGVDQFICVGTNEDSSRQAVEYANRHDEAFASIGVHPHDTKDGWQGLDGILRTVDPLRYGNGFAPGLTRAPASGQTLAVDVSFTEGSQPPVASKIVAIGEIGLDYFYDHSPREIQAEALKWQIKLALQYNLPIIFHVRDAFDDFWPIFDSYTGIRGVLHCFTDNQANLEAGLKRGLYIGVNGISTFTRDETQKTVFNSIPLDRLLFETDAPFLTPAPFRGKINEPAFVKNIAEYHAKLRGISVQEIAMATTANARALFAL